MQWRVRPVLPVLKLVGAVAVVALAVAFAGRDPVRWTLAALIGCGLVGWALRDVLVPVRLAADSDGVTVVTGFARRRHLRWSEVERLRVDRTVRRGLRSELLEIDAGDAIYLFSAQELGALPEDVLLTLSDLRV
ncbi:hypothetical protein ACWT_8133 [Actinoplanes sp. SE50]|uniref:PH domain-containing protein n=1 Tax=unclassified Actinoplanes TaxID=2626549 RepID=UPI00023EDD4C|nr:MULTISPECIES: PH domain-containing protein [unclassified Actinoplanes]AEV89142.1 hypothetical protein ACPL_8264 [Actinoplanes sp. SE50/110]ATO87548.1 hypothetical protein ACWT_8133 [Actinoplanes sp. SE50]SLM04966.1 hypothetical protein ACSP50_8281 [Actinoplanes sp. SE50/110]